MEHGQLADENDLAHVRTRKRKHRHGLEYERTRKTGSFSSDAQQRTYPKTNHLSRTTARGIDGL